jgi:regulation of enolase protein 1 (concanavalin A-like superfamily)
MKRVLVSIILIILVLLLSSLINFSFNIQTVKAQQQLSDDFNSNALDSNWVFTDPDGSSTVNFTANSGWLRITAISPPYKDLYKPVNTNAPRILLSINGNFTVETKVSANTDQEWESGGILIWSNTDNFLRLDRACGASNSQRIVFFRSQDGGWDPTDVVLNSNLDPTYLKISRTGNDFSAYYCSNGIDWISIGEKSIPLPDQIKVGLDVVNVYHDGTFYADFDYFNLISTNIQPKPTPTLDISSQSSTSLNEFKVQIKGNLSYNSTALANEPILLSYSVNGGKSWQDLTLTYTASDGSYSAEWQPSVTGNYLLKAVYDGNDNYSSSSAIVNLAVTSYQEKNVFSVSTNSTISGLSFNSTNKELSFTVSGPTGTNGYANVYLAKTLVQDASSISVYLDGNKIDCQTTAIDDSWLLQFTYHHSTHEVKVNLAAASTGISGNSLENWITYAVIVSLVLIIVVAVLILVMRKKK